MTLEKDVASNLVMEYFGKAQNLLTSPFVAETEKLNLSSNMKKADSSNTMVDSLILTDQADRDFI